MLFLLALVCATWAADPAADAELRLAVQRQEVIVDARAAEVARLRSSGAGRTELGAAMTRYRDAAVRLAELEAPLISSAADAERTAHSDALRRLAEALANDRVDEAARSTLVAWLGEPRDRVVVLEAVLAQAGGATDPVVRRALALDLVEQAAGLALVSHYDAAAAGRAEARANAQASAFRARTAPGQSGGLDLVVAAERAEREAVGAAAERAQAEGLAARYEAVRAAAITLSEGTP